MGITYEIILIKSHTACIQRQNKCHTYSRTHTPSHNNNENFEIYLFSNSKKKLFAIDLYSSICSMCVCVC